MYTIKHLEIIGYDNNPVPNTFFQQEEASSQVAFLLPGIGYTSHMPLLYYPARIMLALGMDVLGLEYDYGRREDFMALSGEERKEWLLTDVSRALQTVLKGREYRVMVLIGKSLGTRAMGHLLTTDERFQDARAIWLTPVLRSERLCRQMRDWGKRSLIVIGTADPHYDPRILDEIQRDTGSQVLVIEGADHSLETGADVLGSLDVMGKVIRAIHSFVASSHQGP